MDSKTSDERQHLLELRKESQEFYDKYLLSFSTGAIVLSITLIDKIVGNDISCKSLLGISWLSLILCIIGVFVSFQTSQKAMDESIKALDMGEQKGQECYNKITNALNILSFVLFIIGICCLGIFSYKNIKGKEMPMDKKGYTAPPQNSPKRDNGPVRPDPKSEPKVPLDSGYTSPPPRPVPPPKPDKK